MEAVAEKKKESLLKRLKNARLVRGKMDFSILLVISVLCAFGLVMIFSASYYYAQHYSGANNDSFYYLKRQLVYLLIGYPIMLLVSLINYRIYVREYPGRGGKFIKTFTLVSWAFFLIVVIPGLLLSRWKFF